MALKSQLRQARVISGGQTYRLVGPQYHPGQGKVGGVTHARLEHLATGTLRDYSFRSELTQPEVAIERQTLEFLSTGGHCCLMNPDTFEQTEIAARTLGPRARLLLAGMRLAVEFLDDRPVSVAFPDVLEFESYPYGAAHAPAGGQQLQNWKIAPRCWGRRLSRRETLSGSTSRR
jgi:translation elongation factor P/translation initiation factor 5A